MSKFKYILAIVILIGSMPNCEKHEYEFPDDLNFEFKPLEAKTTDVVLFSVGTDQASNSPELFYRWDWNGDSIWDTEFSSMPTINKRFFKTGNYKINLLYTDGKGNSKLISRTIDIEQGFSAPKPDFIVTPGSGNFKQKFIFDASTTLDYEDSLNQLLFRWDFQGDGLWDTMFDTAKVVSKEYRKAGNYKPALEVKDPSNLVGSISKELEVHRNDSLISIKISWPQGYLAVGDTVVFDISESHHLLYPDLEFKTSWLWPNHVVWTEPSADDQFSYVLKSEGNNEIRCKVIMDYSGLENSAVVEIFAAEENLPPEPAYEVSIPLGNIHTQFYFDCWGSSDDHLAPSKIFLRWDWENDGIWDTPFSQDKRYFHQYSEPGEYSVALQAMDNFQETKTTYGQIIVSPYENPTGYFEDIRDGELYGTVQIGSQWWMAENLRYEIPWKAKSGFPTTLCLFDKDEWCESVGKLYHVTSVIEDRFDDKEDAVCPAGWHVPTKEDLDNLIEDIGGPSEVLELAHGGSSDFNGLFLGYGYYYYIYDTLLFPEDTIFTFHETYQEMYMFSSSIPEDINEARIDTYMIKISRLNGALWEGYNTTRYYMPVRCVKD